MKFCLGCMEKIDDELTICPHCGYAENGIRKNNHSLMPGAILCGKYIVGRVFADSNFSITYIGWDAEYNRKILIKEFFPTRFVSRVPGEALVTVKNKTAAQFKAGFGCFVREAQSLVNSSGDPISVYDAFTENNTGYVITECPPGDTVKKLLRLTEVMPYASVDAAIMTALGNRAAAHIQAAPDFSDDTVLINNKTGKKNKEGIKHRGVKIAASVVGAIALVLVIVFGGIEIRSILNAPLKSISYSIGENESKKISSMEFVKTKTDEENTVLYEYLLATDFEDGAEIVFDKIETSDKYKLVEFEYKDVPMSPRGNEPENGTEDQSKGEGELEYGAILVKDGGYFEFVLREDVPEANNKEKTVIYKITYKYARNPVSLLKGKDKTTPTPEATPEVSDEPAPTTEPVDESAETESISTPTPKSTSKPSPKPKPEPTPSPTPKPTKKPTSKPTTTPTQAPTSVPTPESTPTPKPKPKPTPRPTPKPKPTPTPVPFIQGPVDIPIYEQYDGRKYIHMPNIVGMRVSDTSSGAYARQEIQAAYPALANMNVRCRFEDCGYPSGTIIGTSPSPGTLVTYGTMIEVYIEQ